MLISRKEVVVGDAEVVVAECSCGFIFVLKDSTKIEPDCCPHCTNKCTQLKSGDELVKSELLMSLNTYIEGLNNE